ncbi:MAG: hypothetical protein AAGJ35_15865, partial [Myxococcota bacterium]
MTQNNNAQWPPQPSANEALDQGPTRTNIDNTPIIQELPPNTQPSGSHAVQGSEYPSYQEDILDSKSLSLPHGQTHNVDYKQPTRDVPQTRSTHERDWEKTSPNHLMQQLAALQPEQELEDEDGPTILDENPTFHAPMRARPPISPPRYQKHVQTTQTPSPSKLQATPQGTIYTPQHISQGLIAAASSMGFMEKLEVHDPRTSQEIQFDPHQANITLQEQEETQNLPPRHPHALPATPSNPLTADTQSSASSNPQTNTSNIEDVLGIQSPADGHPTAREAARKGSGFYYLLYTIIC